ncbi:MAG: thiolase family protein, partial [Desulfomonilaceae bacterium]
AMRVLSGFRAALVVVHSKGSEGDMRYVTNAMFDPIFHRPLGIESIAAAALQANAYMYKYGLSEEDFALISVKNHANALNNPHAHLPMTITVDDVMRSKKLADPIKLLDCSPISDGAAALIIADKTTALKSAKKPVWIKGIGHCCEEYFLGDRDLVSAKALHAAAIKAYEMAQISNPRREIDVVELYDAFSYMEPLWLEGLGMCPMGGGVDLTRREVTAMGGDLPVNPSGGVLSAHALLVAGLVRIIESALQLRGEGGDRQVDGAHRAVAHGVNGPCGQNHCVWVLEKD